MIRQATQAEVDEYLEECGEGTRSELDIKQIAPFAPPSDAFLPILPGSEATARQIIRESSERMGGVVGVVETDCLRRREPEYYDCLPAGIAVVKLGHDTDRTYTGYGCIVQLVRRLAPLLGPARFFVGEIQVDDWIDDFRIDHGQLTMIRWCVEDDLDVNDDVLLKVTRHNPQDIDLQEISLLERARRARDAITDTVFNAGPKQEQYAGVARALLSGEGADANILVVERALLELVLGDFETARKCSETVLRSEENSTAQFVLSVVGLLNERDHDALVHAMAAYARAPWMAEALVIGLALSEPAIRPRLGRDLVALTQSRWDAYPNHLGGPWNLLRKKILTQSGYSALLDAAIMQAVDEATASQAKGAALLLFTWGEALRLAGDVKRAKPFFERAGTFDSLDGMVDRSLGWVNKP